MPQKITPVGVLMDEDSDRELGEWAEEEGRSKRVQASFALRRLLALRKTSRAELVRLGLIDPKATPPATN